LRNLLGSNAKLPYGGSSPPVFDFAVGAGTEWQGFNLQLSWAGVNRSGGAYQLIGMGHRTGAVFSISHSF
jgi:hypothetical protein